MYAQQEIPLSHSSRTGGWEKRTPETFMSGGVNISVREGCASFVQPPAEPGICHFLHQIPQALSQKAFPKRDPILVLQVADYLPLTTPCLSCLRTLTLPGANIHAFPDTLASRLTNLVHLDLRGNSFERLPSALAHITTLETIDLSNNRPLELVKGDAAIIGALSSLETLDVAKTWSGMSWTARSLRAIRHLESKFPEIDFEH